MLQHFLRLAAWFDLEAALWAVLLLVAALPLSLGLRRHLPLWRKGLWLSAMLGPLALASLAAMLPRGTWALTDYVNPSEAAEGESAHAATPAALAIAWVYLVWIAGNLAVEAAALLHLRRLLAQGDTVQNPEAVATYTELARSLGLSRAPRLVQTPDVASPFIVASLLRGLTIVVPQSLVESAPAQSLRAVLAHELAHARAGDPYLQRLAGAVRTVLPLAWFCSLVAMRLFWEDAAEQTCDLRAARASGLSAATYGGILQEMALENGAAGPVAALAFSPAIAKLRPENRRLALHLVDRLRSLTMTAQWSESWARGVGACCRAVGMGGVLILLTTQSPFMRLLDDPRPATPTAAASALAKHVKPKAHHAKSKSAAAAVKAIRQLEKRELKDHRKEALPPA